ncbi:ferredoxin:glutaredoxin reductase [Candidatus Bathyarchaeota archaeon]|jgi:ferredoxin-thioredoxin reductase catalytic subunit|nr:ferredoxin:glutaredoxin reductase [Candidatus Bathyarchaeota archaeon]
MTSIEEIKRRAERDAKSRGFFLTPDKELLNDLFQGLKENKERYGYYSCPCRIASGKFELDRDIICPCDYRDPDVLEYGACYCSLYVNKEVYNTVKKVESIPERRPEELQMKAMGLEQDEENRKEIPDSVLKKTNRKLQYCKVCGYVTFREEPPYICPICQAKREMFEEIITTQGYLTKPFHKE